MKDALGHGSNKRGETATPHAVGINRVGVVTVHPNARRLLSTRANVTVNPVTGDEVKSGGTMVARPGTAMKPQASLSGARGSALLQNLLNRNALAIHGGALVGKWTDPKTGLAAIELADRMKGSAKVAAKEGTRRDQIAVYDLDRKQTIMTGGTGRR